MKKNTLGMTLTAAAFMAGWSWVAYSEQPAQSQPMGSMAPMGATAESKKEFKVVAVEYQGTKIWIPATLIVRKGDKVKITLINNIQSEPNTHGFAINEFGVKTVVTRGKPETVEFTADKEGIFNTYCHLHPAHIGGQILVLK